MMLRVLLLAAILAVTQATASTGPPPPLETSVDPSEVDTTLYFHPLNFQDMPVNTQLPVFSEAYEPSFSPGPTAMTLTCLHPYTGSVLGRPYGTTGTTNQAFHTFYG